VEKIYVDVIVEFPRLEFPNGFSALISIAFFEDDVQEFGTTEEARTKGTKLMPSRSPLGTLSG